MSYKIKEYRIVKVNESEDENDGSAKIMNMLRGFKEAIKQENIKTRIVSTFPNSNKVETFLKKEKKAGEVKLQNHKGGLGGWGLKINGITVYFKLFEGSSAVQLIVDEHGYLTLGCFNQNSSDWVSSFNEKLQKETYKHDLKIFGKIFKIYCGEDFGDKLISWLEENFQFPNEKEMESLKNKERECLKKIELSVQELKRFYNENSEKITKNFPEFFKPSSYIDDVDMHMNELRSSTMFKGR